MNKEKIKKLIYVYELIIHSDKKRIIMAKPWKQLKIFTESEQSLMIEPTPSRDGVLITVKEELDKDQRQFSLYATYDEALEIAYDLITFVNQNKDVSNMLTVKEVLDILDDSDHLDDAQTLIRETVS